MRYTAVSLALVLALGTLVISAGPASAAGQISTIAPREFGQRSWTNSIERPTIAQPAAQVSPIVTAARMSLSHFFIACLRSDVAAPALR